jgi:archaellum biogenesis ATPase FlaH
VVNHLQKKFNKENNVVVVCIFCNYKKQIVQMVSNLVASLLKQMLQGADAIPDNIKSLYSKHRDARPLLSDLTEDSNLQATKYSKVFIVVDTLDKCSEDLDQGRCAKLLKTLRSLRVHPQLLFTSRDLPLIAQDFQDAE